MLAVNLLGEWINRRNRDHEVEVVRTEEAHICKWKQTAQLKLYLKSKNWICKFENVLFVYVRKPQFITWSTYFGCCIEWAPSITFSHEEMFWCEVVKKLFIIPIIPVGGRKKVCSNSTWIRSHRKSNAIYAMRCNSTWYSTSAVRLLARPICAVHGLPCCGSACFL